MQTRQFPTHPSQDPLHQPVQQYEAQPYQATPQEPPAYQLAPQHSEPVSPSQYRPVVNPQPAPVYQPTLPDQAPVQYQPRPSLTQPQPVYQQQPPQYVAQPRQSYAQPVHTAPTYVPQQQTYPPAQQVYTTPQPPVEYMQPVHEPQPVYRAPYVEEKVPTYKRQPIIDHDQFQPLQQKPDEIVIEPSEDDINQEDLEEANVATQKRQPQIVSPQDHRNVSPRVFVSKTEYQPPQERLGYQPKHLENANPKDFSRDEWKDIQRKIDAEYERKLKEVGDAAMNKLKMYQEEHKALLEKTSYLIEQADETDLQREADENYKKIANVQNIRKFQQEFNNVINFGMNVAGELYLVDILRRLHLIPSGDLLPSKEHERELYNLLNNSKDNLLIKSEIDAENSQQDIEGDLTRNLFKICCAILELQVNQRGYNFLDMKLLQSYLGQISYTCQDAQATYDMPEIPSNLGEEFTLIPVPLHLREQGLNAGYAYEEAEMVAVSGYTLRDQLSCIKSLINRPSYSLVDKEMRMIADAFQNFADNRYAHLQNQKEKDDFKSERAYEPTPTYTVNEVQTPQTKVPQIVDPRFSAKAPKNTWNPDVESQKAIDAQLLGKEKRVPQTEPKVKPTFDEAYYQRIVKDYQPVIQKPNVYKPVPTKKRSISPVIEVAAQQPRTKTIKVDSGVKKPQAVEDPFHPQEQEGQLSFGHSSRVKKNPQPRTNSATRGQEYPAAPNQRNKSAKRRVRPDSKSNPRGSGVRPQRLSQPKRQESSEPICVLKVELDGGENVQYISVYEGQNAEDIVDQFARKFNLSENAKYRLLFQINAQINN